MTIDDDDELPPCIGERYRDTLIEISGQLPYRSCNDEQETSQDRGG